MQIMTLKLAAAAAVVTLFAGAALAESRTDAIARHLKSQGYTEIEVSRTWLGRMRIEAYKGTMEREIIVNPRTGEILRDYWEDDDDHHVLGGSERDDEEDVRRAPVPSGGDERDERPRPPPAEPLERDGDGDRRGNGPDHGETGDDGDRTDTDGDEDDRHDD
ncbi:hypothetical protein [Shimia sp.]|uniref:hypothetical protein n=1 Tax=Shimia sp. TaxID=1954381 RepID=UPI003B8CD438